VRDEQKGNDAGEHMIRLSLERRWDVEDISSIGWKEVAVRKTADGYEVEANYTVERPFLANVYLLTKFDKLVTIQR
jgi:hypothetical protein